MPNAHVRLIFGILGVLMLASGLYYLWFFLEYAEAPCSIVKGECEMGPASVWTGVILGLLIAVVSIPLIGKAIKWW